MFEGIEKQFVAERTERAARNLLSKADNDLMRSHLFVLAGLQDLIDGPTVHFLVNGLVPIRLEVALDEKAVRQAAIAVRSVVGRGGFRNHASFLVLDLINDSTVTMMRQLPLHVQRFAMGRQAATRHLLLQSSKYAELAALSSSLNSRQVTLAREQMGSSELLGLNESFTWNRSIDDLIDICAALEDREIYDHNAFVPLTVSDIDVVIEYLNKNPEQFAGAQLVFSNPAIETQQLLRLLLIDQSVDDHWMTEYLLGHPSFPADMANKHWRNRLDGEPSILDQLGEWQLVNAAGHPGLSLAVRKQILHDGVLPKALTNWGIAASMRNDDLVEDVDANEWFSGISEANAASDLRLFCTLDAAGRLDSTHWQALSEGSQSAQYLAAQLRPHSYPMTPLFASRAIETSKALLREDLEWKAPREVYYWWQLPGKSFVAVNLPAGVRERDFRVQDFDVHVVVTRGEMADIACQSWQWALSTASQFETRQFVAAVVSREQSRWLVTFEVDGSKFTPFKTRRLHADPNDRDSLPAYWSPDNAALSHSQDDYGDSDIDEDFNRILEAHGRGEHPRFQIGLRELDQIENDLLEVATMQIAHRWSAAQVQFEQNVIRGLE